MLTADSSPDKRRALDRDTDPQVLTAIAREHPHLRPAVALNPSVDAADLQWLAGLDDPITNAALASRARTSDQVTVPVRRNRRGVLLGVAVGVLVLATAGFFVFQMRETLWPPAIVVTDLFRVGPSSALAVDEAANIIYVPSRDTARVLLIDASTHVASATIKVGNRPTGVAMNQNTRTAYIANADDDTVSVIDAAIGEVVDTIAVGGRPESVAVDSGANTVHVTNNADDTVSVIDANTNEVTTTITVGSAPTNIVVSESTHTAYVTYNDYGVTDDSSVTIIDSTDNRVSTSIDIGTSATHVAVDEATDTAWISNFDEGTISVMETTSNQVTETIQVGREPSGVVADDPTNTVVVAMDHALSSIDTTSRQVTETVEVDLYGGPSDIVMNPSTGTAYALFGGFVVALEVS